MVQWRDLFTFMRKIFEFILFVIGILVGFFLGSHQKGKPSLKPLPAGFSLQKISKPRTNIWNFFRQNPTTIGLITLAGMMLFAGDYLDKYSFLFKASLLNLPETEFTGTTTPVTHVPKWTELTAEERMKPFDQIPKSKIIPLPEYNLLAMRNGKEWKPDNEVERNTYVTYPVPNLGNYRLDGTENSGSHPGIDIKIPIGTPIHSVANGIVYKVGNLSTGFGKSVSVAHINIPDPRNSSQKVTLVSTYAHLSKTEVKEGDAVQKGQRIGLSGDTGFATTPHLHFQIDRSDAPFIPYWPFSWNEVQNAGYSSFFDAVKNGLGKHKAVKYTEHPINFIAKYQNYIDEKNLVVLDSSKVPETREDNRIIKEETPKSSAPKPTNPNNVELVEVAPDFSEASPQAPESQNTTNPTQVEIVPEAQVENRQIRKRGQLTIEFDTDKSYVPGEKKIVKIKVNEAALVASAGIELSSTLKNRAWITPNTLNSDDFINGAAEVVVETQSEYPFRIIAEGDFGTVKSDRLRPEIFADVSGNHTYSEAIKFLKENKVVQGYGDGTFKPDNTLNRAEALKLILEANEIQTSEQEHPFPDIEKGTWFMKYVSTAFKRSIVKGYGDGNFKPGNTVSRAEFIKMAIATRGFEPTTDFTSDPYDDVKKDLWYAKYFHFAKTHSLLRLKKGGFMVPNNPITRGEAADVIYKLSKINKR